MQNPRTGVRWMVAAITSISVTAFAPGHAASVAPVAAENGMVVSAQHLATMVGVDVLKRGGNAVDAAIAAALTLTPRAVEKHINAIFSKLPLDQARDVDRRVTAVLLFLSEDA